MRTNPTDRHAMLLAWGATIAATGAALVLAAVLSSRPAQALPAYARQTGLPCGQCHVDPSGGGPRTAFGRAFARNGHRLPGHRLRTHHSSGSSTGDRDQGSYGTGPGMMRGYGGGMGAGMMGGYGR